MELQSYQAIFRGSPYPYLVLDLDMNIIGASDAYLRSVGRSASDLVGRYLFDAFPPDPKDPDSTNEAEVTRSINLAIATGKPDATAFVRYAIPVATETGTQYTERYWSTVHTPIFDEAGKMILVLQNAIDVSNLYNFDRESNLPSLNLQSGALESDHNFNRAQMHEAVTRILNDERGHLRNLFNQAPGFVAVLTGPKHIFEMVNEAYYQLVGHREIEGKGAMEALPELAGQGFEELLNGVFRTGEPYFGRGIPIYLQRNPNGPTTLRHIDLSYQPYRAADGAIQGIFAQGYDVTDAFEATAAREKSEELLRQGMIAAKMVVWDCDLVTRAIIFSENVNDVLGLNTDSLDDVHAALVDTDALRLATVETKAVLDQRPYQEIVSFVRPDNGRKISLDVRGQPQIGANGELQRFRGVMLDVTERIKAEADLREADRRKDEFLAMLAHELRNPLAPISTAASLLQLGDVDEQRMRMAGAIITRQVGHMTGLVDDLLDVSRVTRGLVELNKENLDLKQLVMLAIEQSRPLIESRGHALNIAMAAQPLTVAADRLRLVQVITNLLNNAAKYTPQGGIIDLDVTLEDSVIAISVKDNGLGIDPRLLPKIFDLFTQAERTSDRSQGGLGLGLALVKSLMELHGGSVTVASEGHGKGSTFTVKLPKLDVAPPQAEAVFASDSTSGLDVILVDDNVDGADTLASLLSFQDHRVRTAHSGGQALQLASEQPAHAYILDIGLPDMDGYELARRLREQAPDDKAVFIALTGYGQSHDRVLSKTAGFDFHLVKPADLAQLENALANCAARQG
ncbi:MAG: ATP-binding protein [Massilia sp.]